MTQMAAGDATVDTGGEFFPLLTQPVATRRIGSNGSQLPPSPPTSHRVAPHRSPPPSAHAAGAPWTDRYSGTASSRTGGSLVHASPQCPPGPRTATGTLRSSARGGSPAAPRDAHALAAR